MILFESFSRLVEMHQVTDAKVDELARLLRAKDDAAYFTYTKGGTTLQ